MSIISLRIELHSEGKSQKNSRELEPNRTMPEGGVAWVVRLPEMGFLLLASISVLIYQVSHLKSLINLAVFGTW